MPFSDADHDTVTPQVYIGTTDYTGSTVFAECSFTVNAAAQPGTARIVLRDHGKELDFTPGTSSTVTLYLNGDIHWVGYAMQIERGYFFDAYPERKWILNCVDLNILLDKYILYNKEHLTRRPCGGYVGGVERYPPDGNGVIAVPANTTDQSYIRTMLQYCSDITTAAPAIDVVNHIDEVNVISEEEPFTPPDSGTNLRGFMEDVSRNVLRSQPGSTIWYIRPNFAGGNPYLVYRSQDTDTAPFYVSDDPAANTTMLNGVYGVNVRSLSVMTDISNIKNDVLIFTGNLNPSPTSPQEHLLYRHNQLTASVTQFGRFQYSEVMSQDWLQGMINARSTKILYQEGTPAMRATFTTFRHGLYPGQLLYVNSIAHTYKIWDTDLSQLVDVSTFSIPIRSITYTFPTPYHIQVQASCSFDTQDPWGLLLALKRPANRGLTQPLYTVIDRVTNPDYLPEANTYDAVIEYPKQISGSKMQCTYAFIRGSLVVYYAGLRLTPLTNPMTQNRGFIETDPDKGVFQLGFTPSGGEIPWVEYHVWHNL